ncbi:major facilitator superfamily domain-containing protein [Lineolata rhizophorae]|uniref:Major facilitator superfamily domain-containing protein n=1 Tax=Lineolata rhizophorae TaxID=578093 RepID=A0A6A6P0U3_9PEZI|nr:major facilitator superfamily domain-containing protein [Lineolata rhizophorae]
MSPTELAAARKIERKAKWKMDLIIIPLLSTVYFLAQMGRSDLGNAKIAGMDEELNLTPKNYSDTASIFLVGYIIFQLPGTLLVRKIGPPLQFGLAMIAWGLVTTLIVTVQNYGGLMATRTFVGVAEAFVQGAVFYLSFWYTYRELATRGALFYSTSALAGSFNGLIAYSVQRTLEGANGWRAWRWIFLIEGVIPMGWGFVIILMLPKTPEKAPKLYFTQEEKEVIIKRSRAAKNTGESKIQLKLILKLLLDPKFWMLSCVDMGQHFCVSSLSNFLPAILVGFGWSEVRSQLMTVIIYACALVGIIVASYISDKLGKRGIIICINSALAAVGYCLLLALDAPTGRFIATCLCAATIYPNIVIILVWTAINNPGYTYRASAAAIINMISQCIAISGNQAYSDPPLYRKGNASALALMVFTSCVSGVLMWHYKRENVKKRRDFDSEEANRLRALYTVDDISHRHPDVFFQY